ncbi:hypothetical protein A2U01_0115430, partial [Trifolium medium]|nr:hypothetical protein [Trifolium medium]
MREISKLMRDRTFDSRPLFERSRYCKCKRRARSFGILLPKNERWRSRNLK